MSCGAGAHRAVSRAALGAMLHASHRAMLHATLRVRAHPATHLLSRLRVGGNGDPEAQ
jgi:hypothetical protein